MYEFRFREGNSIDIPKKVQRFIQKKYKKEKELWGEVEQAIIYFQTNREAVLHLSSTCKGVNALQLQKARECLIKHYRNLIIFPKHLPFNEKKNCLDTKIEWTESMSFSKRLSSYSIEYERISVLYNLTACYNNLGIAHFGSDKKAASKHFATCSWLLSKLIRECKAIKKLGSNELHGDHLAFLKALVAAQTEVCTYEVLKATGKVALVPKVLAEVTARYTEAARLLDKPAVKKVVGSSENKSFAQFNKLYWGCLTHFAQFRHLAQQAGASGEGKEAGDALAHAQLACELHDACKKFVAKMPTRLHKDYADISKEYTVEIQELQNKNEMLYFKPIPPVPPVIEAKKAVKDISIEKELAELPDPEYIAMLRKILTPEMRALLLEYNQQRDARVETLLMKSQEFWNQILFFYEKNKLPQCLDPYLGKDSGLPAPMQDRLAKIQSAGGFEYLLEAGNNNSNSAANCSQILKTCQQVIDNDQGIEDHYRKFYNASWSLPPTKVAAHSYYATLVDYQTKFKKAEHVNQELQGKKAANQEALQLLSLSIAELNAQVPANEIDATAAQIEQAEKLCEEMREMEECKEGLEGFITNLQADEGEVLDILSEIADKKVDKLTGFKLCLNTYNSADTEIEKAQKQSSEILTAISSKLAHLNPSGMNADNERSRFLEKIGKAINLFEELIKKNQEGLSFYMQFNTRVHDLKAELDNWFYARSMERQELMQMIQDKQGVTAPPPDLGGTIGKPPGGDGGAAPGGGMPGAVKGPGHIL